MMRFVDLRGAETGYLFAFYDTVKDQFVEFSGCQAWDSSEELLVDMRASGANDATCERFIGLIPDWIAL